jgi:hypothetical protein
MRCRLITRSWFLALCLADGFVSNLAIAAPPAREAIEWCDIWISHANETNQVYAAVVKLLPR